MVPVRLKVMTNARGRNKNYILVAIHKWEIWRESWDTITNFYGTINCGLWKWTFLYPRIYNVFVVPFVSFLQSDYLTIIKSSFGVSLILETLTHKKVCPGRWMNTWVSKYIYMFSPPASPQNPYQHGYYLVVDGRGITCLLVVGELRTTGRHSSRQRVNQCYSFNRRGTCWFKSILA